jgi:hypothetical protein
MVLDLRNDEILDFLVIGSGPSGAISARKLLERGLKGLILDAGQVLPTSISKKVYELSKTRYKDWNFQEKKDRKSLTNTDNRLKIHAGSKLLFGSDFAYTQTEALLYNNYKIKNATSLPVSHAKGGFSNVWGATFFPLSNYDKLSKNQESLLCYYDEISKIIPVVGFKDKLASVYPLPDRFNSNFMINSFALGLESKSEKNASKLAKYNSVFGFPRLALKTNNDSSEQNCQFCGLCGSGCVYNSIWNSATEINALIDEHGDIYKNNFIATKIVETDEFVEVTSHIGVAYRAKKIFLATGALSTSLLLSANGFLENKVQLCDTQVTLLPFIVSKKQKESDTGFVLSKGFLHIIDRKTNTTGLSVQIIGYNQDFSDRMKQVYPFVKIIPDQFLHWIARYLGVALVYQKMEQSGRITISRETSILNIDEERANTVHLQKSGYWINLIKSLRYLGLMPVTFFIQKLPVGLSYHLGSLRDANEKLIFDELGRINRKSNVHVLDGASLPDIFPGSITNTIMANALKIASKVHFS